MSETLGSVPRTLGTARLLAFALAMLALSTATSAQQGAPVADDATLTPVKIILAMEKAYATCRSYRDTGVVKTRSVTEDGRFGSEQPFATAFVRPDRFRFQFTDTGLGNRSSVLAVWLADGDVLSWWDAKPGVRAAESLQQVLGAAAGLSEDVSVRVPGLLLPKQVGTGGRLLAPERLSDATDRDATCLRIKGKSRATPYTLTMGGRTLTVQDETVTLWVDSSTHLLRKVEENRTFDTYRTERTTTYTAEVNVEIAPAELVYAPPGAPPQ